jgi:hypothetical protein
VPCNQYKHGNLIAYREGLIQRIGLESFEQLEVDKTKELRLTIPQAQDLIAHYKNKVEYVQREANRGDSKAPKAKKGTLPK